MASRPWANEELAVLHELAERLDWAEEAADRLPNRSNSSIHSAMTGVRRQRGIVAERGRPSKEGWMTDAINGTTRLFEALQRTGLRPA